MSSGNSLDYTDKCLELMAEHKARAPGGATNAGDSGLAGSTASRHEAAAFHACIQRYVDCRPASGEACTCPPLAQAAVKEMEAAAIAWVCTLYDKPLLCVKAITDIVDGGRWDWRPTGRLQAIRVLQGLSPLNSR